MYSLTCRQPSSSERYTRSWSERRMGVSWYFRMGSDCFGSVADLLCDVFSGRASSPLLSSSDDPRGFSSSVELDRDCEGGVCERVSKYPTD